MKSTGLRRLDCRSNDGHSTRRQTVQLRDLGRCDVRHSPARACWKRLHSVSPFVPWRYNVAVARLSEDNRRDRRTAMILPGEESDP
jgi:hypothetical protein